LDAELDEVAIPRRSQQTESGVAIFGVPVP
jgi:hypothetical protein